MKLGPNWI